MNANIFTDSEYHDALYVYGYRNLTGLRGCRTGNVLNHGIFFLIHGWLFFNRLLNGLKFDKNHQNTL